MWCYPIHSLEGNKVRIALAQIWQETHTFSPLPTGLREFEANGLYTGRDILDRTAGAGEMGGFLAAAEADGDVEPVPIVRAWALSSGRITAEALTLLEARLVAGLAMALPVDGVFLSLHGATAADGVDDVAGYLLQSVRHMVGPDLPVVASLDHHANITRRIVEHATALVGYRTLPHDPFDTGERAARLLFATVRGELSPRIGWQKIPLLAPADRGSTDEPPMQTWFDTARRMEQQPGVIAVSPFPVQPWLDVEELGWAVVAVTDNDPELAQRLAAELADQAWALRDAFWDIRRLPPAEAIRQAAAAPQGPIIVADASDSVLSGATGDGTCLLREMLRQEIGGLALVPMVDAPAVEAAISAGAGQVITVPVGGTLDRLFGQPVTITARVEGVAPEGMAATGPWGSAELGRTALLSVGAIRLLVSERRGFGGADPEVYRRFGVEPARAQLIVVKMYFNYQSLHAMMKGAVMADCPGLSTWNLRQFRWDRAPRPLYPLDDLPDWRAG